MPKIISVIFFLFALPAQAQICYLYADHCRKVGVSSSMAPAYPSKSSTININPSAVPIEKGLGVEGIVYKTKWDFALVRGNGRIGAAISPTNGEETFFGAPSYEIANTYLDRKIKKEKYSSQKFAAAASFGLYSNKKNGLKKIQLNAGLIAKYNHLTESVWPGAGLSGIAGPFTFGYSYALDETLIDFRPIGIDQKHDFRYGTQTFSLGLFLNSLALDYSRLHIRPDRDQFLQAETATIDLYTASLLLPRAIITVARRVENSDRPRYDKTTRMLQRIRKKEDMFFGAQISATKNFMVGAFYGYYLLDEVSLGATFFF